MFGEMDPYPTPYSKKILEKLKKTHKPGMAPFAQYAPNALSRVNGVATALVHSEYSTIAASADHHQASRRTTL